MPQPEQPSSPHQLTIPGGDRSQTRTDCVSCGSLTGRWFSAPDGRAMLCPPCATLHGLGCP